MSYRNLPGTCRSLVMMQQMLRSSTHCYLKQGQQCGSNEVYLGAPTDIICPYDPF